MKNQFVILFLLTFMVGCKKSDTPSINNDLIGTWVYTANKIGIAGPGQWAAATPAGQTIEFKSDGSFVSSNNLWSETQFQIIDSVTVKLWPDATSNGYVLMGYSIDKQVGDLLMWNVDPMCIEGCEYKYERVQPN